MVKSSITVVVDADIISKIREKKLNVSKICNEALINKIKEINILTSKQLEQKIGEVEFNISSELEEINNYKQQLKLLQEKENQDLSVKLKEDFWKGIETNPKVQDLTKSMLSKEGRKLGIPFGPELNQYITDQLNLMEKEFIESNGTIDRRVKKLEVKQEEKEKESANALDTS